MISGATVLVTAATVAVGNAWIAVQAQSPEPEEPSSGRGSGAAGVFDFITPFLNVGLVGVLLLMFVFRKGIVPEWVLKQTEERHKTEIEKKDADIAELKGMVAEGTKLYNDQVVPAFTRSIDVNREYVELLRRQTEQLQRGPAPRRRTQSDG